MDFFFVVNVYGGMIGFGGGDMMVSKEDVVVVFMGVVV